MKNNESMTTLSKKRDEIKQNHKMLLSLLESVKLFLKRNSCYKYYDFCRFYDEKMQISNGGITMGNDWNSQSLTITSKKIKYNIIRSMYGYENYKTSSIDDLLSNIDEDENLYCFLSQFQKDFFDKIKEFIRKEV